MYTIIGGDGREYGPVTADQVRQWIAGGRANLDTRTKAVGSDEWKTVADFPDIVQPTGIEPPLISPYASAASGRHGSRWARFFAYVFDSLASGACMAPVLKIMATDAAQAAWQNSDPDALLALPGLAHAGSVAMAGLLSLELVQLLLLTFRGQTIGKLVFRLRVVRYPDSAPAGFLHAWLLRRFVWLFLWAIPGVFFLDSCFIFGENRRTLHDRMAGTKVIPAE